MAHRHVDPVDTTAARRPLPSPLTSFVGRVAERATLEAAVRGHRLVTATGPGGVGKTRLALAAAEHGRQSFDDGVVFVDLVQVAEPAAVIGALADAAGVPERVGATRRDALLATLEHQHLLLVLDNCEHLADAARRVIADVLDRCPHVTVLATSRLRLLLPGEHVVAIPGMSLDGDDEGGDAVALFVARARSAGADEAVLTDHAAIRHLCSTLDGMALAIEIGAARVPSLGIDGLRRALDASLDVLELVHGADDRHRSVRATIDWSYRLLDEHERRVVRSCSVFGAPFDVDAAANLLGEPPVQVMSTLGRLVDWSLVTLRPGTPTRYRILETVRQHSAERSAELGELEALRLQHARWCGEALDRLTAELEMGERWASTVDAVADDARGAVAWLASVPAHAELGSTLAARLGGVVFLRGWPGEAQQRFEQAATLATMADSRHDHLVRAARAALARYVGGEAVELLERAAEVAEVGGADETAAYDMANAVTLYHRHIGTVDGRRTDDEIESALARAERLGGGSPLIAAAVTVARSWTCDLSGSQPEFARQGVELTRGLGDPLLLDAALDAWCASQMHDDDLSGALATVHERLALMAAVPIDVMSGMDHADARLMAVHTNLACGDLPAARRWADALAALPFLREEPHVALARRIEADALAGWFDDAVDVANRFAEGWRRSGCPRVNSHGPATYAAAMVHGILGDDDRRAEWIEITKAIMLDPERLDVPHRIWPALFDATLDLHRERPDDALRHFTLPPDADGMTVGLNQIWLSLYAATWAEASFQAGRADAVERARRASHVARHHPVARAIIERSVALNEGHVEALPTLAERFSALGCPYQHDRTLMLARLAGEPTVSTPVPFDLTVRELEVVALVAAGCTNPQIAEALYISRKTAEHHVSRILAKLGVSTRAEAAALATRMGLDASS